MSKDQLNEMPRFNHDELYKAVITAIQAKIRTKAFPAPPSSVTTLIDSIPESQEEISLKSPKP